MKCVKILCILSMILATTSCSQDDDDGGELEFSISSRVAYLIPAETASCLVTVQAIAGGVPPTPDISQKYFSMLNPVLRWTDPTSTGFVAMIKIKITSGNIASGEYSCTISGEELSSQFKSNATDGTVWDFTLTEAAGARGAYSACPSMKCGGINLTSAAQFITTATIEVYGFARDNATLEERPVRARSTINIENIP